MSMRLSRAAEAALLAAEEEARKRRQSVGTPHLLIGLLSDMDGRPAMAMRELGLSVRQVQYEASRKLGRISAKPMRRRPERSPTVDAVIDRATAEVERRSGSEIDPEDILIALVADPEAKAASLIKRMLVAQKTA